MNKFLVTCQHQATASDLPFHDIFASTKNSSLEASGDVIACDLRFGPPQLKILATSMGRAVAGNPKAAGSDPVERHFFALLVLSSSRSGGSSLGFRAGSLLGQKHAKQLNIKIWPANVKTILIDLL